MTNNHYDQTPLPGQDDAVQGEVLSDCPLVVAKEQQKAPPQEPVRTKRPVAFGVFFACILFGFLLSMQFKSVDISSNALTSQQLRAEELQALLNKEREKNQELYEELLRGKDDLSQYREQALQSGDYATILADELARAELAAGFTDVVGPGLIVTMSDSNGYIVDENGIDYKVIKEIKEVKRARIKTYLDYVPTAKYVEGSKGIWTVPCDIALPCATQNELQLEGAEALVANGCYAVAEGANMPSTPEAIAYLQSHGILFAPAKAANAGGVATSGLEMSQNSLRLSWTFEEVDERLHNIMVNIYKNAADAAERYGMKGNLVAGANIAGFEKIASAMMSQGVV